MPTYIPGCHSVQKAVKGNQCWYEIWFNKTLRKDTEVPVSIEAVFPLIPTISFIFCEKIMFDLCIFDLHTHISKNATIM